jgi:hypothetical protein
MTTLAQMPRALLQVAGTVAHGAHSVRLSRQLAGARTKLTNRALFKFDAELGDIASRPDALDLASILMRPVPAPVVHFARELLRQLPPSAPDPKLVRDNEGSLSFQWFGSNERSLTIRVNPDGMLIYSGRLGMRRRISGAEPLTDDLPQVIRQAIKEISAADR